MKPVKNRTGEGNHIEYLCKVFKGLSTERKEALLDTARQLLTIQHNEGLPLSTEKPVLQSERQGIV